MFNRRQFLSGVTASAAIPACELFGLGEPHTKNAAGPNLPSYVAQLIARERESVLSLTDKHVIEGVAVCLNYKGEPVWSEGFGTTSLNGKQADSHTMFSIQSTSKNFTAVGILLAVQHGLLDLDTPLDRLLPGFKVNSRFESNPERKITMRLLLSHRAGFTHEAPVGNNYEPWSPSFEEHVASISRTWLRFPVDERYRYSNLGVDLAGYVLQTRTGVRFEDWVERMLFRPLDMRSATFDSAIYVASNNRAVGHETGYPSVPLRTPLIPSGGVYISADDMQRFSEFHLGRGAIDGKRLLSEELWDEMHGFGLGGDYGLGVIRTEERYGDTPLRLLSHKGGGFGFGSVFVYCPKAGLAWAAMFNRPVDQGYNLGQDPIRELLVRQFGSYSPRLRAESLAGVSSPAAIVQAFVGHYTGRNGGAAITGSPDGLKLQDHAKTDLIHFLSPTELFIDQADGGGLIYDYTPATAAEPAHLECFEGELSLDSDTGVLGEKDHSNSFREQIVGAYVVDQWGKPALHMQITVQRGRLLLDEAAVVAETAPRLYYLSDGEVLDFRSEPPTWKNLKLIRLHDGKPVKPRAGAPPSG